LIFFCARSKLQNSLKYISQLHPCEDTKIEKLNDMNDSALGLTRIDFQSAQGNRVEQREDVVPVFG